MTLRGVFYRVVSAGAVEKTELGYRLVGRQLLKLAGRPRSYADITDGTRWISAIHLGQPNQMLEDAASIPDHSSTRRAFGSRRCHVPVPPADQDQGVQRAAYRGDASAGRERLRCPVLAEDDDRRHPGRDEDEETFDSFRDLRTASASFHPASATSEQRNRMAERTLTRLPPWGRSSSRVAH